MAGDRYPWMNYPGCFNCSWPNYSPHERIDIQHELDRITAERDEAREWARKYKKKLDGCYKKQKWYAELCDDLQMPAMERDHYKRLYEDLERKYKQATCEHRNKFGVTWIHGTCPECGKEL